MATLECFENLIWLKITIRTIFIVQLNLSFFKMFNNTTIFKHFQSRDYKNDVIKHKVYSNYNCFNVINKMSSESRREINVSKSHGETIIKHNFP